MAVSSSHRCRQLAAPGEASGPNLAAVAESPCDLGSPPAHRDHSGVAHMNHGPVADGAPNNCLWAWRPRPAPLHRVDSLGRGVVSGPQWRARRRSGSRSEHSVTQPRRALHNGVEYRLDVGLRTADDFAASRSSPFAAPVLRSVSAADSRTQRSRSRRFLRAPRGVYHTPGRTSLRLDCPAGTGGIS